MKPWKSNYTALLIAETLAIMGFGLSSPVLPLFLEEDIGVIDPISLKAWVGIINSCASVTLAVFAPIWGHLADTFSRRAMLLRAMFGGAVVITLCALVRAPWQLLVLKSIQGCLTGTVAAATVLTAGIAPAAHVAFALGLLQTAIYIGNSLGPLVGGVLSDFMSYRATFYFTGAFLALAGFIVAKWVEDNKKAPGSQTQEKKKFSLLPDVKPILKSPLLVTLMLVTFGVAASNNVANPMLPLFLKDLARNMAVEARRIGSSTGIVLGVGSAFTALAAVLVGKFSARLGYWKVLIFCLGAGAVFTVPQAFVANAVQLTVFRAFSSFFLGGCIPVINAIIAIYGDKEQHGTIYGFNASITSAGSALGPLAGSLAAMISYRLVFIVAAAILVFSCWKVVRRRKLTDLKAA
jgi:DHA1 family multidrug resistance protein-like MFS transporter